MGNQQNKLERQFTSLPAQNFPSTSGHATNPNFVRKSLRGSRGSKRKQKALMQALRQQNMEIHGQSVPFIDGLFLPQYPVRNDISLQDFEVEGVISKGAYGNVIKVKGKQDQSIYAIKTMKKSKVILENAVQQIREEAEIYSCVGNHPFIVQPLWFFQNRENIYIVMEYIPRGELFTAWKHYGQFSEALVQIYIAELAMVLDFLHHSNIIYRDLKMENILIDAQGHLQLIDFGLAKCLPLGHKTRTVCGTLQYIAPEVLSMEPYTHAVDWWSLGIMMFALLTGQYPVRGAKDHFEMAAKVMGHAYELPDQQLYSQQARDCVKRLLRHNPSDRLCDLYMLEGEAFFSSLQFDSLLDRQLTPKVHLQRQKSDVQYEFIHARDQSFDGYLANQLLQSSASLNSLDDFAGFDMTRSQSVDGWFDDTPGLAASYAKTKNKSATALNNNNPQKKSTAMSRSSSMDHLEDRGVATCISQPNLEHSRGSLEHSRGSKIATGGSQPSLEHSRRSLEREKGSQGLASAGNQNSGDQKMKKYHSFDMDRQDQGLSDPAVMDRLAKMGAKQVPMITALQQEAQRLSGGTQDLADVMGKHAQNKRQRSPERDRVGPFHGGTGGATPKQTTFVNPPLSSGASLQRSSEVFATEDDDEEDQIAAMRNAAAKMAKRRSKSADLLSNKSCELLNNTHPPPPELPRREPLDSRRLLNKSVDGAEDVKAKSHSAPKVRVRSERDQPPQRPRSAHSKPHHRKSASGDGTSRPGEPRESLENLSHKPVQGSTEDMEAVQVISLGDLDKIPDNFGATSTPPVRNSYQGGQALRHSADGPLVKRRSRGTPEFAPMHKVPISPAESNEKDLDVVHKRMESLTGEVTHHQDKVREWLNSTPDIEAMDRYDFENDISVGYGGEDNLWYKDDESRKRQMPGSNDNRMQFIDSDTPVSHHKESANIDPKRRLHSAPETIEANRPKTDRSRMMSTSAMLDSKIVSKPIAKLPQQTSTPVTSSSNVIHSKPVFLGSKDSGVSPVVGGIATPIASSREKENQPPGYGTTMRNKMGAVPVGSNPKTPSESILRQKQSPGDKEEYPPYLSSRLSESTQALFEKLGKVPGKQKPVDPSQMYLYRYSDSTHARSSAIDQPLTVSTIDSGEGMLGNLHVGAKGRRNRDSSAEGVTYGPGSNQNSMSSPVSSYATVIEHSVISEDNRGTASNRNSYVNEKDWAKVMEHLGLSQQLPKHSKPSQSPKQTTFNQHKPQNQQKSNPNSTTHSSSSSLAAAFPTQATSSPFQQPRPYQGQDPPPPYTLFSSGGRDHGHPHPSQDWGQPKLRSLQQSSTLSEHQDHSGGSNRSTPISAQSAPNPSYVNVRFGDHKGKAEQVGGSKSRGSTPSSSGSHAHAGEGYVNVPRPQSQVEDGYVNVGKFDTEGEGYVNVARPGVENFTDGDKVNIREFAKIPAKPPRKPGSCHPPPPPDTLKPRGVSPIRERVGGKDPIYMEINDARRLLYEGQPPTPSQLGSSSMHSFETDKDQLENKLQSKSSSDFVEGDSNVRQRPKSEYFPDRFNNKESGEQNNVFKRSASVENALASGSQNYPWHSGEQRGHQFTQFNGQKVQLSRPEPHVKYPTDDRAAAKTTSPPSMRASTTVNKSYEPESRSASESPIDALWSHVTSQTNSPHSSNRHLQEPASRSLSPLADDHTVSSPRTVPSVPLQSHGEPAMSRKFADIQSEESSSGYTSMGNSLGSKDGLGSPKLTPKHGSNTSPDHGRKPESRKILPPPIKPKPKMPETKPKPTNVPDRPKHLDLSSSSPTKTVQMTRPEKPEIHFPKPPPQETDFPLVVSPTASEKERLRSSAGPMSPGKSQNKVTSPPVHHTKRDFNITSPTRNSPSLVSPRHTPTKQFSAKDLSLVTSYHQTREQSPLLSPTGSSASSVKPAIAKKPLVLKSPQKPLPSYERSSMSPVKHTEPPFQANVPLKQQFEQPKSPLGSNSNTPASFFTPKYPHEYLASSKTPSPLRFQSPTIASKSVQDNESQFKSRQSHLTEERRPSTSDTLDSGYKGSQDRERSSPESKDADPDSKHYVNLEGVHKAKPIIIKASKPTGETEANKTTKSPYVNVNIPASGSSQPNSPPPPLSHTPQGHSYVNLTFGKQGLESASTVSPKPVPRTSVTSPISPKPAPRAHQPPSGSNPPAWRNGQDASAVSPHPNPRPITTSSWGKDPGAGGPDLPTQVSRQSVTSLTSPRENTPAWAPTSGSRGVTSPAEGQVPGRNGHNGNWGPSPGPVGAASPTEGVVPGRSQPLVNEGFINLASPVHSPMSQQLFPTYPNQTSRDSFTWDNAIADQNASFV